MGTELREDILFVGNLLNLLLVRIYAFEGAQNKMYLEKSNPNVNPLYKLDSRTCIVKVFLKLKIPCTF